MNWVQVSPQELKIKTLIIISTHCEDLRIKKVPGQGSKNREL